jgi:glycosyltransferase involved in cell wall biosynthesis
MLRLTHGVVANSYRARQNLVVRGVQEQKIVVVPNALDLREFDSSTQLPPSLSLPAGRVMAAAVGSLQPSKRFDRFLEALAIARRRAPALCGVICGADQGCRGALEAQAQALGLLPEHVLFAGECRNVPAVLARCGFLVMSSDYEGFPNVVLEAMAARLPVISTPVGDVERIVRTGETGFVVPPDDPELMAQRMVDLALATEQRLQMGHEARERVGREYNFQSLADRMLLVFAEFANRTRRTSLAQQLQSRGRSRDAVQLPGVVAVSETAA